MNYHNIKYPDVANGEGIRVTLFISGCEHHCKGCHNAETWDYNSGKPFISETLDNILKLLSNPYVNGLTLSGGDPLAINNRKEVLNICKKVKEIYPNKTIWLYTGYTFEEIKNLEIVKYIDVIVDGKFILEKRNINLKFRGSDNQRIIKLR